MNGSRLCGIVNGWSAIRGFGWIAADGIAYFLHASHVDELAVAPGVVVEFVPRQTPKGWAATEAVVLRGAPPPIVGPRVTARVLQVVEARGYIVALAEGNRLAIVMTRDVSGDGELVEGARLSGELVQERAGRFRLLNVAAIETTMSGGN